MEAKNGGWRLTTGCSGRSAARPAAEPERYTANALPTRGARPDTVNTPVDKGAALLAFLKATATIRRKRVSSYETADKVLLLADIPRERGECRSPFLTEKPEELAGLWLEVRKKRMPARPLCLRSLRTGCAPTTWTSRRRSPSSCPRLRCSSSG